VSQGSNFSREAESFCRDTPHRYPPFNKRNWGGKLHSLCSYQGKLKPAIAYFLIETFTEPNQVVLDPMSGVGTIPLEARRLGRIALANDLSPLAQAVSSAKVEQISSKRVGECLLEISREISETSDMSIEKAKSQTSWGLNGNISEYFHPETLREITIVRRYFQNTLRTRGPAENLVLASMLHILHGNRPYALSRNSHPITPFAPTGDFDYRSVMDRLESRIATVLPLVEELAANSTPGKAILGDFREMPFKDVDAVITSPPFTNSLRFWSANWMRLWFSGWDQESFKTEPSKFLESEQRLSYEPYREFAVTCAQILKPGGRLILHLGETAKDNMAEEVAPMINQYFSIIYSGREGVHDTETHGLTDKGATSAHLYLFAERNSRKI